MGISCTQLSSVHAEHISNSNASLEKFQVDTINDIDETSNKIDEMKTSILDGYKQRQILIKGQEVSLNEMQQNHHQALQSLQESRQVFITSQNTVLKEFNTSTNTRLNEWNPLLDTAQKTVIEYQGKHKATTEEIQTEVICFSMLFYVIVCHVLYVMYCM